MMRLVIRKSNGAAQEFGWMEENRINHGILKSFIEYLGLNERQYRLEYKQERENVQDRSDQLALPAVALPA